MLIAHTVSSDPSAFLYAGNFVSSDTQYPTGSWLPESVKALLGVDTKLQNIVYTHAHWVGTNVCDVRESVCGMASVRYSWKQLLFLSVHLHQQI